MISLRSQCSPLRGELLTNDFHLIYVLELLWDDDTRSRFLEVLNSNIFEKLVKKTKEKYSADMSSETTI